MNRSAALVAEITGVLSLAADAADDAVAIAINQLKTDRDTVSESFLDSVTTCYRL